MVRLMAYRKTQTTSYSAAFLRDLCGAGFDKCLGFNEIQPLLRIPLTFGIPFLAELGDFWLLFAAQSWALWQTRNKFSTEAR